MLVAMLVRMCVCVCVCVCVKVASGTEDDADINGKLNPSFAIDRIMFRGETLEPRDLEDIY